MNYRERGKCVKDKTSVLKWFFSLVWWFEWVLLWRFRGTWDKLIGSTWSLFFLFSFHFANVIMFTRCIDANRTSVVLLRDCHWTGAIHLFLIILGTTPKHPLFTFTIPNITIVVQQQYWIATRWPLVRYIYITHC